MVGKWIGVQGKIVVERERMKRIIKWDERVKSSNKDSHMKQKEKCALEVCLLDYGDDAPSSLSGKNWI